MIKLKIKTQCDFWKEVRIKFEKKGKNANLFTDNFDNFNGTKIRAGPKVEKVFNANKKPDEKKTYKEIIKEYKEDRDEYQEKKNSMKFLIPDELKKQGAPMKEIQRAMNTAEAEKEPVLNWMIDKFNKWKSIWKILKEEREIEEEEKKRKFDLKK